jgi:hypothetical protein
LVTAPTAVDVETEARTCRQLQVSPLQLAAECLVARDCSETRRERDDTAADQTGVEGNLESRRELAELLVRRPRGAARSL